jgi:hypothetical protein
MSRKDKHCLQFFPHFCDILQFFHSHLGYFALPQGVEPGDFDFATLHNIHFLCDSKKRDNFTLFGDIFTLF